MGPSDNISLSIVIPCLNEGETVALCVREAKAWLEHAGIRGEIIVADNGSEDDSAQKAVEAGARVVPAPTPGYGSALIAGCRAAQGQYIMLGDADGSYDFSQLDGFMRAFEQGADFVLGCRLPSGGGRMAPGSMRILHRWIGNPAFALIVHHLFRIPIHDPFCGLRGIRKSLFDRIAWQCHGMEFALEMVVRSAQENGVMTEIPISFRKDARICNRSHLRTFRDGWRGLSFLATQALPHGSTRDREITNPSVA